MFRKKLTIAALLSLFTLVFTASSFAQDTTTFTMNFSTLSPGFVGLDTIDGVCVSTPGGGASNPDIHDPSGNKSWGPDQVSRDGKTVSSSPSSPLQSGYHYQLNISVDLPADVSQCVTVRFKGTKDGTATEGDKSYRMCYDAETGEWGPITCIDNKPVRKKILPQIQGL